MSKKRVRSANAVGVRGEVTIVVRRPGSPVRRIVVRNTITYLGLNAILALLANDGVGLGRLVPGTNGTPPTPGDIAMGSPLGPDDQIVLSGPNFTRAPATRELLVTGTLATTQANGETLREIGLRLVDGTLFARQVHPAFEKDGTMSITYTWRIAATA